VDALGDFLGRYREALIFIYVFADQLGVPLPAIPALLAMGAFAAAGKLNLGLALLLCVVASVLADCIWYAAGRRRGADVPRLVCQLSLEPDSCVRRTEDIFVRYGVRSLVVAKFVPGLSTIAPRLAGIVGVGVGRFVAYSAAAAFLWAGAWGGLGYLAGDAMKELVARSGRLGSTLLGLVLAIIIVWVGIKWIQRQRFLRSLRIARISPDDVKRMLDAGTPVVIVDLRSELEGTTTPFAIRGALRIAAEQLEQQHHDIPRDRDIVLYCS